MLPLRTLACAFPLALTACATHVPWPPRAGGCIEAIRGRGKNAGYRYRIAGRVAGREDVERALQLSPRGRAAVAGAHRLEAITWFGVGAGFGAVPSGLVVLASNPKVGIFSLVVLPALAAGITAVWRGGRDSQELFRSAVLDYNARAAWEGTCPRYEP